MKALQTTYKNPVKGLISYWVASVITINYPVVVMQLGALPAKTTEANVVARFLGYANAEQKQPLEMKAITLKHEQLDFSKDINTQVLEFFIQEPCFNGVDKDGTKLFTNELI